MPPATLTGRKPVLPPNSMQSNFQKQLTTRDHPALLHITSTLLHNLSTLLHITSTLLHNTSTLLHTTPTLLHTTSTLLHNTSTLLHTTSTLPSTLLHTTSSLLHTTSTLLLITSTLLHTPRENDLMTITRLQIIMSRLGQFKTRNDSVNIPSSQTTQTPRGLLPSHQSVLNHETKSAV